MIYVVKDLYLTEIFDGYAAGSFIISDEIGADEIFEHSLITYSKNSQLNGLIEYYLNNIQERNKIVQKARDIVLNHHTFGKRVKKILKIIPLRLEIKKIIMSLKLEKIICT